MSRTETESTTGPLSPLRNPVELARLAPLRRIPGRNATKADLVVYRIGGVDVAVKDYAPRPVLVRNTIGRWLVRREARAYRAAEGLPGVPEFLGRIGPLALATRWIPATPLSACSDRSIDPAVFDRLEQVVGGIHARGVALGDLHHRDVLVDRDGSPHVVDFATAWVLGERPGRFRRKVFRVLRDQDRIALARLRARFTGGDPESAARSVSGEATRWYAVGRRLKSLWNRVR